MPARYLYLFDEESGREVQRWTVDGLNVLQIMQLERQIMAGCGEGVVLRDSLFEEAVGDEGAGRPAR